MPVAKIDLTPKPGNTPAEYEWFLFHLLPFIQEKVDHALSMADEQHIEYLRDRTVKIAQFTRQTKLKLDKRLTAAYVLLLDYIEAQAKLAVQMDELFAQQMKARAEYIQKAIELQRRKAANQMLGLLQALGGALQTEPVLYFAPGGFVARGERLAPDFGDIFGGIGRMAQAQADYLYQRGRLDIALQAFAMQFAQEFAALQKQYDDNRKGRMDLIRKIGVEVFQLEEKQPLDDLEAAIQSSVKAKSFQPLIELSEAQAKYDRGTGTWDNPFALCVSYNVKADAQLAANQPAPTKSQVLFGLAEQAVAAVRLVPPDPLFDPERVELLRISARLACTAAKADLYQGYWSRAYSGRAAAAIRWLDQIDPIDKLDVTGEVREQRAVALLLVGRVTDALEQIQAVAALRDKNGTYHYHRSRILSAHNLVDMANNIPRKEQPRWAVMSLDSLKIAMKMGFNNLKELKNEGVGARYDSDFNALFAAKETKDAASKLVKLNYAYFFVRPAKTGDPWRLRLINTGAFTISHPKFDLSVIDVGKKRWDILLNQQPISLAPGAEIVIELNDPGNALARKLLQAKLEVVCEQGKDTKLKQTFP